MQSSEPICTGCAHFRPDAEILACAAYPAGIPDRIIRNLYDHRRPYRGDGGTQFAPVDDGAAAYAERLLAELPPGGLPLPSITPGRGSGRWR